MFGDIITDLGAAIQGGMGMAASGNSQSELAVPPRSRVWFLGSATTA